MSDFALLRQAAGKAIEDPANWAWPQTPRDFWDFGFNEIDAQFVVLADPQTVVSLLDRLENEREGRKVAEVSLRLALSRLHAAEKVIEAMRRCQNEQGCGHPANHTGPELAAYDALSNSGTTNTNDASSSVVVDPSEEGESE